MEVDIRYLGTWRPSILILDTLTTTGSDVRMASDIYELRVVLLRGNRNTGNRL